jgi:hypothetical protein
MSNKMSLDMDLIMDSVRNEISLEKIAITDVNALKNKRLNDFDFRHWNVEIIMGQYSDDNYDAEAYAIKITSKHGKQNTFCFLCTDLFNASKLKDIERILDTRGVLECQDMIRFKEFINFAKANDFYTEVENLEDHLSESASPKEVERIRQALNQFMIDNPDRIASKEQDDYTPEDFDCVKLDTVNYKKKHNGEIVIAMPCDVFKDSIVGPKIASITKRLGRIKLGLERAGVLIAGTTDDKRRVITLATNYVEKCLLFRVDQSLFISK